MLGPPAKVTLQTNTMKEVKVEPQDEPWYAPTENITSHKRKLKQEVELDIQSEPQDLGLGSKHKGSALGLRAPPTAKKSGPIKVKLERMPPKAMLFAPLEPPPRQLTPPPPQPPAPAAPPQPTQQPAPASPPPLDWENHVFTKDQRLCQVGACKRPGSMHCIHWACRECCLQQPLWMRCQRHGPDAPPPKPKAAQQGGPRRRGKASEAKYWERQRQFQAAASSSWSAPEARTNS